MHKPFAIAVLTLLASTAFAVGEVYRWKDTAGVWHYSDQPHPGAEVVRSNSAPSTAVPAPSVPAPPAPLANDPLPVSKEVAQQVRDEASAAKAKRCEKATAEYASMVQALRIKRPPDAKGNVTFLTPAEMDKARLDARAAKDLACAT